MLLRPYFLLLPYHGNLVVEAKAFTEMQHTIVNLSRWIGRIIPLYKHCIKLKVDIYSKLDFFVFQPIGIHLFKSKLLNSQIHEVIAGSLEVHCSYLRLPAILIKIQDPPSLISL